MRYLKTFESYNGISIYDVAWLYFLHYVQKGKMEVSIWKNDNRMSMKCSDSLSKFDTVS